MLKTKVKRCEKCHVHDKSEKRGKTSLTSNPDAIFSTKVFSALELLEQYNPRSHHQVPVKQPTLLTQHLIKFLHKVGTFTTNSFLDDLLPGSRNFKIHMRTLCILMYTDYLPSVSIIPGKCNLYHNKSHQGVGGVEVKEPTYNNMSQKTRAAN